VEQEFYISKQKGVGRRLNSRASNVCIVLQANVKFLNNQKIMNSAKR